MKSRILIPLGILLCTFTLHAQHQDVAEKPSMWRGKPSSESDTTSLLHAFKSGVTQGHFRYFFMSTDNQKGLSDYYANAAGGGIRFESARFHGFQAIISGFFIFNIGSSDLSVPDSLTGQSNRYELALFDVEDPVKRNELERLEEFLIKYNFRQSSIQFGKLLVNTPLINLQDGRMRPTGVEGVWIEFRESKTLQIEGGYLFGFSPRGTTRWHTGGESIGIYPVGVDVNGARSGYAGNVESQGTGVLGFKYSPVSWLRLQLWDFHIDNVLNSALVQGDATIGTADSDQFFTGAQFIRQDAIGNGGNEDPDKVYVAESSKAMTFGARAGWRNERWETSVAYNRITSHGRYLFPREWGRDPFFTFMPRERNEGFGDLHALVGKVQYTSKSRHFKTSLAVGRFSLPDVKNFELNKYGLPSYNQINADVRYSFGGLLKGMEAQLLVVAKTRGGNTYDDMRYEINKVNMVLYNFVLNYHF